jgi:hypothetical protein
MELLKCQIKKWHASNCFEWNLYHYGCNIEVILKEIPLNVIQKKKKKGSLPGGGGPTIKGQLSQNESQLT